MPWSMPRDVERQACRMRQMIDRLDVDRSALVRADGGDVIAAAAARCLDCRTLDECLSWLDGAPQLGETPDFCPNRDAFAPFRRT